LMAGACLRDAAEDSQMELAAHGGNRHASRPRRKTIHRDQSHWHSVWPPRRAAFGSSVTNFVSAAGLM